MIIAKTATPPAAPPAMAPTGALFEAAVTAVGLCVDLIGVSEVAVEADDALVDTVEVEAAAEDPPLGENDAATAGFELRKPDVRSPVGHPFCRHGLDLQHPMNAGVVKLHVYHWPAEHCWSGNWP
jgi:hypothetical protein